MKKYGFIVLCLLLLRTGLQAQELNCEVKINYSQIQGSANKQIFDQLEKSIFEFMNNTNKWTNLTFTSQEKIECSIFITVDRQVSTEDYSGSIQVQCSRPVYKSSYKSKILNVQDEY